MPRPNNKETPPTDWRRQAREVADSLAIAFILAMVIRHYVLEVFKIPTKSMQPTLLGDPWTGDKILVNKFAYDFRNPRRWDVIVFKYPKDTSRNYIKRLIGLPGETITVLHGDIYIIERGQERPHIARKPWRVQQALWRRRRAGDDLFDPRAIPRPGDWPPTTVAKGAEVALPPRQTTWLDSFRESSRDHNPEPWIPEDTAFWKPGDNEFTLDCAASPDTQYIDYLREILAYEPREAGEHVSPTAFQPTSDIMVQFLLIPERAAGQVHVRIQVETHPERDVLATRVLDRWRIVIPVEPAAGKQERRVELFRDGAVPGDELTDAPTTRPFDLPLNRPTLVQVCNVDQSIIVRIGDRQVLYAEYQPSTMAYAHQGGLRTRARVQLGGRDTQVTFRRPALFADVYYTANPDRHAVREPFTLGDDEFFVCGDNSANSNDSRDWGPVPRRYLVGEAFLILWPLSRLRIVR